MTKDEQTEAEKQQQEFVDSNDFITIHAVIGGYPMKKGLQLPHTDTPYQKATKLRGFFRAVHDGVKMALEAEAKKPPVIEVAQ